MGYRHVLAQLHRLYRFWQSLQIELHGRYSLGRFDSLVAHAHKTSNMHNFISILLVPAPSLVIMLAIEALPLHPAIGERIQNQTVGLYLRVFATNYLVATTFITQIQQSTPSLPMSQRRLAVISAVPGLVGVGCFYSLGLIIGFPTPFVIQLVTGPWAAALTFMLWVSWRHHLRMNEKARISLRNYLNVFAVQVVIIFIYSAYNILFISVSPSVQTLITLILPIIKLVVKNMVASGLVHMKDLAPAMVVFNVDVFHGVFVSSTTQQAASIHSTVVIMVIDALLLCIAFSEVASHKRRVDELARGCLQADVDLSARVAFESIIARIKHKGRAVDDVAPNIKHKGSAIDYALAILATSPHIRKHEKFARQKTQKRTLVQILRGQTIRSLLSQKLTVPVAGRPDKDARQVQYVTSVLKLLRMIEFYVLIEFVEFIISAFYTMYMATMAYAPSRVHYHQLKQYSHDEMMVLVSRTALYASAEFVSLVLMCCIMNRKLAPLSAPQQLAFVVQTHWKVVHAAMVMWIILTVQLTFEHYGTDYTFRFEWLRTKSSAP